MSLLEGRIAIVTGAASGIGRAIALKFAAEGALVVVADTREDPVEGGEPTVNEIRRAGRRALFWPTDVSQWADIDRLVGETARLHGRLDVMVNNAATYTGTKLVDTTEEQWNRVMAVNLTGMFFGCKRAVMQMLTQEPVGEARGRIVNISSQHGMVAAPGDCAYGVSKAGAVYLTRQVAADYAKDLIVCNAVAPGKILTGKPAIDSDPARLAYSKSRTPWPRLGRPNDVANAALYLASDLASYVTGTNLMVDGGWMAA
ncbi:MAG TPA: SDR family oxidoreductase [Dongiaceae bacterium]|nr:SDR family oxidoreductase [Dongiaceae bacterium]